MPEQNFRVKNGINVGTAVTITTTEYQVGNTRIHSSGVEARSIIVTDNAGISTVPQLKLTGRLYDANNNVGTGTSVLVSTGIGVSWIAIATAALQGVQGVQGTFGTQGTQGILGTQGTTGIQGTTGVQGTTGTQGTLGTQGIQGITGAQGFNGTLGTQGATGTQGTQGATGTQGTTGTQGIQGITGPTGGSNTQVLFNSSGTSTGDAAMTFNSTDKLLTMTDGFYSNDIQLDSSRTFPTSGTLNGGVFGPYTIASGITLTISSGSNFTIL